MKQNKKSVLWVMLMSVLVVGAKSSVHANEQLSAEKGREYSEAGDSARTQHKIGAYLGLLGDPHPTLAGFNLAYNLNDMMRASIGVGKVTVGSSVSVGDEGISSAESSVTTVGAAMKFMVPGWNLTPSGSLGLSKVSIQNNGPIEIEGYKSTNIYLGLGGDFQSDGGFNVGAGLNVSMNGGAPSAPYINFGYFL
jgi:hypothetical protein